MSVFRGKFSGGITLAQLAASVLVVAAVGIVTIPKLVAMPASHRDAQRVADLKYVRSELEAYYNDHQAFPAGPYDELTKVMDTQPGLPHNPTGEAYSYRGTKCSPGCQSFELSTRLEDTGAPAISVGPNLYTLSR